VTTMIWRNLYLLDAVTVGDLNFSESAPFSCPLLELAVLLSSLSELLSLSLWLSLSERGGEGALGAGEDGFDGEGAMLAFLRGDGDLFAFRVMGTGAIPTLLSELSLSPSESLSRTYSVLSVDGFAVFLETLAEAIFLAATTASLILLREGISK